MPTTPYLSRADALSLIVEQRSRAILGRAAETSVALSTFRTIPVSSSTLKMNLIDTFPNAKWLVAGAPPNDDVDVAAKPVTTMSWTDQDLTVEEAAVIVVIPENVLDDSEIDLWAEVEARCAEAVARLIDSTCFFGVAPDGSTIPASFPAGGIHGQATAAGNDLDVGSVDMAEDINQLMAMVEEDGFDASRVYSGTGVRASLRGLRNSNGDPIYATNFQGSTSTNTVWGAPISYVTNGAWDKTKSQMITGDPQMAIIGMRQRLTAKRLDQATVGDINLAERDALALRLKMRMGFTIIAPKGPASGANDFPFATLNPPVVTP